MPMTQDPERSYSERMISSKLEFVAFMTTFSQRATGSRVLRQPKDANSIVYHFNQGGSIQVVDLGNDEDFILNISTARGKIPVDVKFSTFFSSLPFPASEQFLDNETDDISEVYLNYIMTEILRKSQEFNELEYGKVRDRGSSIHGDVYYRRKQSYAEVFFNWFWNYYIPKGVQKEQSTSSSESEEEEPEMVERETSPKPPLPKSKQEKSGKNKTSDSTQEQYNQDPIVYPEIPSGGKSEPLFGVQWATTPFGRSRN